VESLFLEPVAVEVAARTLLAIWFAGGIGVCEEGTGPRRRSAARSPSCGFCGWLCCCSSYSGELPGPDDGGRVAVPL
jgi:hypothetical protein